MNWGAVPLAGVSRHFSRGQIGCSHLGINSPAMIEDTKIIKRLRREALRKKTCPEKGFGKTASLEASKQLVR